MARTPRSKLESRSGRLSLPVRKRPHAGPRAGRGIKLTYRRRKGGNGGWVAKVSNGAGGYWERVICDADDFEDSNGRTVLSYHEALDAAKRIARGDADQPGSAPTTVAGAIDAYEKDLKSRAADFANARRVSHHLSPALASMLVHMLSARDLRAWRNTMVERGARPASINRCMNGLRAALLLSARLDPRITNRQAILDGLRSLPGATRARRMVLADDTVKQIIEAAFAYDRAFAVFVQTLAETGARASQVERLCVRDLQAARDARLLMPTSYKGKSGAKERSHVAVPISSSLARLLKQSAAGRGDGDPLLVQSDGSRWNTKDKRDYKMFRAVVERAGLDKTTTAYSLRHSSITRALVAGVPTTIVARLHDTSTKQIELHYAAYIQDYADKVARCGLLQIEEPTADNIVPLVRS
jgi:integrase